MKTRSSIIIAVLGLFVATSCATNSEEVIAETQNMIMEERKMAQRVARGEGFPKLYDIPSETPSQYNDLQTNRFAEALIIRRDSLLAAILSDTSKARMERQMTLSLVRDGQRMKASLQQVAADLVSKLEQDRARAAAQAAMPVPQLGGLPPKDQR